MRPEKLISTPYNRAKGKTLYYIKKPDRWSFGVGALLPEAYRTFWKERYLTKPQPVHYIENPNKYVKDEYGFVYPVQNRPLPIRYPKELNEGIWGGEAVIQGFKRKSKWVNRVPKFWVPTLKKNVLYSEVLNEYMKITVTNRAMLLIHENYGFDNYLLKTKACDLMSFLALHLKRKILIALADKTLYPNDPVKREEVYEKYKYALDMYTREEIEWYGLTFDEARKKYVLEAVRKFVPVPLKHQFRSELIAKLKEEKAQEESENAISSTSSWLSKINPFSGKDKEAEK